jgi:C-terminus of AA_permease
MGLRRGTQSGRREYRPDPDGRDLLRDQGLLTGQPGVRDHQGRRCRDLHVRAIVGASRAVNIGTLFAFILVSVGVLVLRRKRPDLARPFRCPGVPVVPILAILTSFYLMLNLPAATWIRFVVWMIIGLAIYFLYGAKHSRLATDANYSLAADEADEVARDAREVVGV